MPQSRKRKKATRTYPKGVSTPNAPAPKKGGKNRTTLIIVLAIAALVLIGAVYYFARHKGDGAEVKTASGLKYVDLVEGTGASPKPGQSVTVNYIGTLASGKEFNNSYKSGAPYTFIIGRGNVIKAWDEGVMTMKVGGKRRLIVPPNLGYGPAGNPPNIPGNATLIFEVELLDTK